MEFKEKLILKQDAARKISKYLAWEPGDGIESQLGEDSTIGYTVVFQDGTQMDVKVCGSQYDEDDPNSGKAWTEAVLFSKEGYQLACTEPDDTICGVWKLEANNNTYQVDVLYEHTDEMRRYEAFKLQWMLDHGKTLTQLVRELDLLRQENPDATIRTLFDDWEFGYGFGSEIWPSFEEWKECEGKRSGVDPMDRRRAG